MSTESRQRARQIFMEFADLPAAERGAALDRSCEGNAALRAEVEALLRAEERASGFMASPTAETGGIAERAIGAASIREGPGSLIGPYKLLQLIGEGGFGSVFMAAQEKPVARKVAAAKAPRVYNLAVVFRLRREADDSAPWHRLRVVVSRKGIRRIERIA